MIPTRRRGAAPRFKVSLPAAMLAAACLALSLLLLLFGRPEKAEARVAALEARLKAVQTAGQTPGDLAAFPADTVCQGKLRADYQQLIRVAVGGGTGLEIEELSVSDAGKTHTNIPLDYYEVNLKAKGLYEAAVAGLSAVGELRPTVFVDTVVLRNRSEAVDFELKGRVFCR